jgi:hypothetical protein
VHSAVMSSDWVARGIAGASAVVAMTSFLWGVVSWRLNGPALRIHSLAYREVLLVRVFNAGRTAESIEHIVLGGSRGGAGGLDLTRPLELPLRLEPGETKSWRLNPHANPLAGRWSTVTAGWDSLWLLTGSMRQHRVEVMPFPVRRPPSVGWRLVPRRTKLARYAPLVVGFPVALLSDSAGMRPLSTWLVAMLGVVVAVRAFWVMGTSRAYCRRRVERWALAFASLVSVVLWARAGSRSVSADAPTADTLGIVGLLALGLVLAVPGAAPNIAAATQLLGDRAKGVVDIHNRRPPAETQS